MIKNKIQKNKYNKGAAMLVTVIFFLLATMTIVLGMVSPVLKQVTVSKSIINSKESYFHAEGAVEDALYRVKNSKSIASSYNITQNGYTTTVTVTTNSGSKTIGAVSDRGGLVRKMEAVMTTGVGSNFNYGIQTGNGGFDMSNNSFVVGNVYSNGDITGSSGTYITGSAVAANTASLSADQTNDTPDPISSCSSSTCITFDNGATTEDVAQSFQVSQTMPVNKVTLYIKKVSTPTDLTVRIVSDNAGSPSTNVLDTATISASNVSTNFGWIDAVFVNNALLNSGTTYWIVIDGAYNASKYYIVGANSAYASGGGKIGKYSGTWNNTSPSGLDLYFKLYIGGLTSVISGTTVGQSGSGDARAHTINNVKVYGSLYCQSGTGNKNGSNSSISCNTSQADPVAQPYPVSDANITDWKADAQSGGVFSGNKTQNGGSLGPIKITGNLTLSGTVTINGTVWVQGNVTVNNNTTIKLASSYGASSGLLVIDGYSSLSNNVVFQGSGTTGSYIMYLSTSDCPTSSSCSGNSAIDVQNNVTGVIFNAQNGTIHFSNNASAKEATAYKISLDNNASVTYESGLANTYFSSGPSGGWNVDSWQEVQ